MKTIVLSISFLFSLFLVPTFSNAQVIISPLESKVKKFTQDAASQLMKKVSPNTGRDSYASNGTWTFDPTEGLFEIPMTAYWKGATWAFGDTQTFYVQGILRVQADGENPNFTVQSNSSSVDAAKSNNFWLKGAVVGLVALSVAGSN